MEPLIYLISPYITFVKDEANRTVSYKAFNTYKKKNWPQFDS